MIEKFSYNLHEYDGLVKIKTNKSLDRLSNDFLLKLDGKSIQDIIHILKVSNIVGDLSLGKIHDYREVLLKRTNNYVRHNFSKEDISVWEDFYTQVIMLNQLYKLFLQKREEYFEENVIKSKLSINLLLVCLEKVLRNYSSNQLIKSDIEDFEKLSHIRDILKGYAAEILKYFMFIDKEKNISHQIYSERDVNTVCEHFTFYDTYESIKDIMEYFRFSKINVSLDDKFSIEILDREFNESVLVSNFREKGSRNSSYNHLVSNLHRSNLNLTKNSQELFSVQELTKIFGTDWKNMELGGISLYHLHKAYLYISELCDEKLKKSSKINQLYKMCIVKKKIEWINKLARFLNVSKDYSQKIIDYLTFSNASYDLIDTPFIELEDSLIVVPSISEGTSIAYAIISNFSKHLGEISELSKKGYVLENKIANKLKEAKITFVSNIKDNLDGEDYEIDHIFVINKTIYFVECKTLPFPYTVKEHAEQQCQIFQYLRKFSRNVKHFLEKKELFISDLRLNSADDIRVEKIFVTSTMRGNSDNYNGINIVDESAFSSFLSRQAPAAWDLTNGKKVLEQNISYYKGEITTHKLSQFFKKPAPILSMRDKMGIRREDYLTHSLRSYGLVKNSQYLFLNKKWR